MNYTFRTILLACVLTLSSAFVRAESVPHEFNSMSIPSELEFSNSYKTATTSLVTYSCAGNAVFGMDLTYGSVIALNITGTTGVVTTSPAIEGLKNVSLSFYPSNEKRENIHVWISANGVDGWTDLSAASTYDRGTIDVPMPAKGNYFLKLTSPTSGNISIISFTYTTESCNCLRVVTE